MCTAIQLKFYRAYNIVFINSVLRMYRYFIFLMFFSYAFSKCKFPKENGRVLRVFKKDFFEVIIVFLIIPLQN